MAVALLRQELRTRRGEGGGRFCSRRCQPVMRSAARVVVTQPQARKPRPRRARRRARRGCSRATARTGARARPRLPSCRMGASCLRSRRASRCSRSPRHRRRLNSGRYSGQVFPTSYQFGAARPHHAARRHRLPGGAPFHFWPADALHARRRLRMLRCSYRCVAERPARCCSARMAASLRSRLARARSRCSRWLPRSLVAGAGDARDAAPSERRAGTLASLQGVAAVRRRRWASTRRRSPQARTPRSRHGAGALARFPSRRERRRRPAGALFRRHPLQRRGACTRCCQCSRARRARRAWRWLSVAATLAATRHPGLLLALALACSSASPSRWTKAPRVRRADHDRGACARRGVGQQRAVCGRVMALFAFAR